MAILQQDGAKAQPHGVYVLYTLRPKHTYTIKYIFLVTTAGLPVCACTTPDRLQSVLAARTDNALCAVTKLFCSILGAFSGTSLYNAGGILWQQLHGELQKRTIQGMLC